MKRTINLLGLWLYFISSSGQPYVFFQAGLNYSMLQKPVYTLDGTVFDNEFSYQVSMGIKTRLTSRINLSIGLDYNIYRTAVSIDVSSPASSGSLDYDLKLGCASLFLLPEYYFGPKRRIFINAGPCLSVITSSDIKGTYEGSSVIRPPSSGNLDGDLNGDLRKVFFGILGNAGFMIKMSKGSFFLPQLGYYYGLVGIEKTYGTYDIIRTRSGCFQGRKMRALSFIVEFDFCINKKNKN